MKFFSTILTILIASLSMVSCSQNMVVKSYNEGINIIPTPRTLTINPGEFTLKRGTKFAITNDSKELTAIANHFIEKINASTGFSLKLDNAATKNVITLTIDSSKVTEKEGYILDVSAKNVNIIAATPVGVYYGMQTFMQLLPAKIESSFIVEGVEWKPPLAVIEDAPRFDYRGVMLDVTRHFVDADFVKRQIDVLSMLKINRLHIHFTDDQLWAIEIKKYPKLTETGSIRTEGDGSKHQGFYTQEQIKDLVAYADSLYVEIVPEIELPGHALAALKGYPEYSCTGGPFELRNVWGVEEDVYCAGNDDTFAFLEDILTEVAPLFSSPYIHIGGDECPKVRWEKCPKCQARIKAEKLKNEFELQSYFVQRIEKHVNKLGKKIIGWDEILEGGINPSATIMSWRGEEGGIEAANAGHDVIMTPGDYLYLDKYQGAIEVEPVSIGGYLPLEKVYGYDPVSKEIAQDKAHHVMGVQGNLWAEYMYSSDLVEYRAYPRVVALAEIAWSDLSRKDYKDFERRINNMYVRLDSHNINYHIPMPEGVESNYIAFIDSTSLAFNNTRNYPMVYTVDSSEPSAESLVYNSPISINKNTTVKIATLLPSGKLSRTRTITIAQESLSPAFTGETPKGVLMSTAKGHYINSAAYRDVKFSEPVLIPAITNYSWDKYKDPNVDIYEGYFEVSEDGVYGITSDNEELWIDGKLVIDNNDEVARHHRNKSTKALAKGKHSFKLIMNNCNVNGWPKSWSPNGFLIKSPSSDKYVKAN